MAGWSAAQGDLWAFYTEASVYGQEVFTCGGARGCGSAAHDSRRI
jgi:hypothetical protein